MKITVTIDVPELDKLQSQIEQFDSLHAQYRASLSMPGVSPSSMIDTFLKDAANIDASNDRAPVFIQNLYSEAFQSQLATHIINKRVAIQNQARELVKELDKHYMKSETPLQLARKNVTDTLDVLTASRIEQQASRAALDYIESLNANNDK